MQAIIVSITDMWPSTITSSASSSPPPSASIFSVHRPFESEPFQEISDLTRPNPFPSPEPPAGPPEALSPPLQLDGPRWILSPPSEERESIIIETVGFFCKFITKQQTARLD